MQKFVGTILVIVVCLAIFTSPVTAGDVLEPGDIAIIGYNINNNSFAFVCLTEIQTGTIILFTDNGWSSYTNKFRTGETIQTWDTPDGCNLGQVVSISSSLNLSTSGDQIFVYQENADGTPSFIFGLNFDGATWLPYPTLPNANNSNLPDSLAGNPLAAIAVPEKLYGYYHGERSFKTTMDALNSITSTVNWTTSDSPLVIPTTPFSFTTTAVHLSDFSAETERETAPWWIIAGLVVIPVLLLGLKRPKRDCCK